MKLVLFINRDVYANLAYNLLLDQLQHHDFKVYTTSAVGTKDKDARLKALDYYEQAYFLEEIPKLIREQAWDTDFDFFNENCSSTPIKACPSVEDQDFLESLIAFEPDLFISIRFGKIMKEGILAIPKYGTINLHSAILPDFRGISGTLQCLKSGRNEYGVSLHYIDDASIDTGRLIQLWTNRVDRSKSLFAHQLDLYPAGCKMILDFIATLEASKQAEAKAMDLRKGNYYSVPTSADLDALKDQGFSLFKRAEYIAFLQRYITPRIDIDFMDAVQDIEA